MTAHTDDEVVSVYLKQPPDSGWRRYAACRGEDPNLFYPAETGRTASRAAKLICVGCPVQRACLETAFATRPGFDEGVWGRTSITERRKMRRRVRKAKASP